MIANDGLRRIRYILDFDDTRMIAVFAEAGQRVTREQVSTWLKKDDNPAYEECSEVMFATFLNGLINQKRGKKDGPPLEPEQTLTNNIIFRKLKIAFNLQAEDPLEDRPHGSSYELQAIIARHALEVMRFLEPHHFPDLPQGVEACVRIAGGITRDTLKAFKPHLLGPNLLLGELPGLLFRLGHEESLSCTM